MPDDIPTTTSENIIKTKRVRNCLKDTSRPAPTPEHTEKQCRDPSVDLNTLHLSVTIHENKFAPFRPPREKSFATKMDDTLMLVLLVIVMLVGSYLAGSIPLVVSLSEVSSQILHRFPKF